MDKSQLRLIKYFYNNKQLRFNELKGDLPSNKCSYHLNRLCQKHYLKKKGEYYILTKKGEKYLTYSSKYSNDELVLPIKQPIQNILLFPVKGKKYLFQKRTKVPFYSMYGPIGTKRRLGKRLYETAEKKLLENTGLTGKLHFKGVIDSKVYRNDKLHLHYNINLFKINHLKGDLIKKTDKGENIWTTEKEYYKHKNILTAMHNHFSIIKSKQFMYIELDQYQDDDGKFLRGELVRKIKI